MRQEVEYQNHISVTTLSLSFFSLCLLGGGERARTDDLLLAKQALSQLSYTPTLLYA